MGWVLKKLTSLSNASRAQALWKSVKPANTVSDCVPVDADTSRMVDATPKTKWSRQILDVAWFLSFVVRGGRLKD